MAFSQIIRHGKLRASFASGSVLLVISSTFISITTCLDFDDDMKWYNYNNYKSRDTPTDLANPPGNDDISFFSVILVIVLVLAVVIICARILDNCGICGDVSHLVDEENTSSTSPRPRSRITRSMGPIRPNIDRDNWIRATPAIFTIARPSAPPAGPSPTWENDVAPAYESPPAYNECVINMDVHKR